MEATVVCIDNSEWTRNGDYTPTRFQAQADAVNLLAGAKTEANPENTVGVLTMAGKTPRVLVTPTTDLGKILNSMQGLEIEGASNFSSAVQIAQLALKHRQNKHQRQRIVLFVGSPIAEDKDSLVKTAKKLKKNNVAVDVVSLAAEEENTPKLEAFQEAVNSGDNSHLVVVPAGTILSDSLYSTPLFQGDGHGFAGEAPSGAEGGDGFNFGMDPSLDPELALALRVSLEEERARQEAAQAAAGGQAAGSGTQAAAGDLSDPQLSCSTELIEAPANSTLGNKAELTADPASGGSEPAEEAKPAAEQNATAPAATTTQDTAEPMDEDALLQQALALSMGGDESASPDQGVLPAGGDTSMFDAYDEELQNAIDMSMAEVQPGDEKPKPSGSEAVPGDAEYVMSVLDSLPGVNTNDPALQDAVKALEQMGKPKDDEEEEKDGK